jgi:glycerol-3-phosphate dehydrogenase
VRDRESGEALEIRAATVVNATGVWADRLRPEELHDEAEVPVIRPSRGTHIVLPGDRLPVVAGAIAPAAGNRTVFVLPWLGQTLVGTTDNDYEGDLERVAPSPDDVGYAAVVPPQLAPHRRAWVSGRTTRCAHTEASTTVTRFPRLCDVAYPP